MSGSIPRRQRIFAWTCALAVAAAFPLVFRSGFTVSLLCQIGIMVIFSLSYNMLLGQTGLLSFGHAVYFGLGAFYTMHALNGLGKSGAAPVTLLPLVGGIVGLLFAAVLGYVTTKKAGTTFTMISLGLGEMVAACPQLFPGFFGGEGGVAGNRVVGPPGLFGITYGSQLEMYYLILGWVLVSSLAMFALTQTPLGRIANAVRDNPERAEFVGYDARRVRYLMMILSGFFAGLAGGLSALNYEIVTAEALNTYTSSVVLLMTFVGGIGFFSGPIIGAILITVMQTVVGGMTKAWPFYFGILFLGMVLFAPSGIAGLATTHMRLWNSVGIRRMAPTYGLATVLLALPCVGVVALVEMTYQRMEVAAKPLRLLGMQIDLGSIIPWLVAICVLSGGLFLLKATWPRISKSWAAALASATSKT